MLTIAIDVAKTLSFFHDTKRTVERIRLSFEEDKITVNFNSNQAEEEKHVKFFWDTHSSSWVNYQHGISGCILPTPESDLTKLAEIDFQLKNGI